MSGIIGAVHIPQPIPDPNLLHPETGQRQSSPTFSLRSTPPVFRVLVVGGNNSNVDLGVTRAAMIPTLPIPPSLWASRFYAGARPSPETVEFATAIGGTGAVSVNLAATRNLSATLAGLGSVVAEFVRTEALAASLAGAGSVQADLSGGSLGASLELTDETSTGLTLTAEAASSETLTDESPDSLTLTPA